MQKGMLYSKQVVLLNLSTVCERTLKVSHRLVLLVFLLEEGACSPFFSTAWAFAPLTVALYHHASTATTESRDGGWPPSSASTSLQERALRAEPSRRGRGHAPVCACAHSISSCESAFVAGGAQGDAERQPTRRRPWRRWRRKPSGVATTSGREAGHERT